MKKTLAILLVLCLCLDINARIISSEQAEKLAQNFLNKKTGTRASVADADLTLALEKNNLFYVFNNNQDNGFIIVSANDATTPVLGYTDSGSFCDEESLPDGLKDLLESYEKQLELISDSYFLDYSDDSEGPNYGTRILTTPEWGQRAPYNNATPNKWATGCVATAMAEIMYYHRWPQSGVGAYDLPLYYMAYSSDEPADTAFVDFGSTEYDWDNMPLIHKSAYTTQEVDALSTLMYQTGMSVSMRYGSSGSGAPSSEVGYALTRYFRYSNPIEIFRDSYPSVEWERIMRDEIDQNRPVLYTSSTHKNEGHAFVLDGYQDNMFHFNWGWNGKYNGYFILSDLVPDSYIFDVDHSAIVGIEPNRSGKLCSPVHFDNLNHGDGDVHLSMDVNNVVKNGNFCVFSNWYTFQKESYSIAAVLLDEDYNVKEVLSEIETLSIPNSKCMLFECSAGSNAAQGDMIGLVTINPSTNEYEHICSSNSAGFYPYTIPAKDYNVEYVKVNTDLVGPIAVQCSDSVIRGNICSMTVDFKRATQFKRMLAYSNDGVFINAVSDHMAGVRFDYIESRDYVFWVTDTGSVTINLHAYYSLGGAYYLHCPEPGLLDGLLTANLPQLEDKTKLVVTGSIDVRDMLALSKVSYIDTIDLYQANIEAYDRFPANTIPPKTFQNSDISVLMLPKTATTIQYDAFTYSNLKSITMEDVSSIDIYAFSYCTKLEHLYVRNETPPTVANTTAFYYVNARIVVHVPILYRVKYITEDVWKLLPEIKADIYMSKPIASDPEIEKPAGHAKIFNLSGQEIDRITNSGIYIINGEKKYQEAY
ncbi:MAG: C10 family peptidase [Bacteroidaceae bacterium]|nr:C10 family peptidase [Bacteroidaceae bacterium]